MRHPERSEGYNLITVILFTETFRVTNKNSFIKHSRTKHSELLF